MSSEDETDRPRRVRADRVSGFLIAVLMLVALSLVARRIDFASRGPALLAKGSLARAIEAKTPEGQTVRLADYRGKVVLVDFWATWCPPCVASLPLLSALQRGYGDRGFVVLGLDQEPENVEGVRAFAAARALPFPVLIDPGNVSRTYGVSALPTSFLIGRDGTIDQIYRGPADELHLRHAIETRLLVPLEGAR